MTHDDEQQNSISRLRSVFKGKWISRSIMVAATLALSVLTVSLIKSNTETLIIPQFSEQQRPIESMVFLQRTNNLEFLSCVPSPTASSNPCGMFRDPLFQAEITNAVNAQFSFRITGSAALVGHDTSRGSSYVLTAYHVCDDFNQRYLALGVTSPVPHTLVFKYTPQVTMTDYFGNTFDAEMVRGDEDNDLCLLESDQLMDSVSPIRIASEAPEEGERIYNVASPHGISRPGAVLSYEGYFAGTIPAGSIITQPHYLSAIPTAPGSSGSAVLNDQGEIITIVSYGFLHRRPGMPPGMWPNASAGPSLEAIRRLIRPRRIQ